MAKNKKQDRSQKAASQAERGRQQAQQTAMEAQTRPSATPGDLARKNRERRFGHN